MVIYLTSSCCGQEVRGHLSDIILLWSEVSLGVVVIYLSSSCCGQEVRGHLFDILLWFVEGLFGGGGHSNQRGRSLGLYNTSSRRNKEEGLQSWGGQNNTRGRSLGL